MRPVRLVMAGDETETPVVPLDVNQKPFVVSLAAEFGGEAGDATVQFTMADVWAADFDPDTAVWYPHPDMTGMTDDTAGTLVAAVTGVRLIRNGGGGADPINFIVIQAGI